MYDIFLIHDGDLFEIAVRGCLLGEVPAADIARTIEFVPSQSTLVLDLTELDRIDRWNAKSMRQALRAARERSIAVCCAGTPPLVRRLVLARLHQVAALRANVDDARRAARRLAVA